MTVPHVSVKMATRNHHAFIQTAIESVLEQQTDFPFEVVICDDASTDGTADIVRGFERRYPDRIRSLPPRPHLGMKGTFHRLWDACRGEFVANLDGDDFWTSPIKLQMQRDFMQSHPGCVLSFHNVEKVDPDGRAMARAVASCTGLVDVAALLQTCFIPSAGTMIRRDRVHPLPPGFDDVPMSDWPLYVTLAGRGEVRYLDAVLGAWRFHPGGAWTRDGGSSREDKLHRARWMIDFYSWALGAMEPLHAPAIQARLIHLQNTISALVG